MLIQLLVLRIILGEIALFLWDVIITVITPALIFQVVMNTATTIRLFQTVVVLVVVIVILMITQNVMGLEEKIMETVSLMRGVGGGMKLILIENILQGCVLKILKHAVLLLHAPYQLIATRN